MRFARPEWFPRAALALAVAGAYGGRAACADVFVWAGGPGPDGAAWCNEDNWLLGNGYPGQHDTADMVLVPATDNRDAVLNCAPAFAIDELIVVKGGGLTISDKLSVTRGVTIAPGATLKITGTLDDGGAPAQGAAEPSESRESFSCGLYVRAGWRFVIAGSVSLSCRLVIEPGGWLRVIGTGQIEQTRDVTNAIGGEFWLEDEASYRASANIVLGPFDPSGRNPVRGDLEGKHPDTVIYIEHGRVLTNQVRVLGTMTIRAVPGS